VNRSPDFPNELSLFFDRTVPTLMEKHNVVGAAVMLFAAIRTWRNTIFRTLGRVHYSAFALSQVLLVAWMGYWGFFFV